MTKSVNSIIVKVIHNYFYIKLTKMMSYSSIEDNLAGVRLLANFFQTK